MAAPRQEPRLEPHERGPRFKRTVFPGSSGHPASTHYVRSALPPAVHPPACEPAFPGPGGGRRGPARRRPASVSPPRRPLIVPRGRGDPSPTPTSSYGARSPGSPKSPEPRTSGPPGSAPSTPHSPLRQPNPDPPTAAPAYRGPARSRPPAATPAQKEPAPAGFHSAQAHQLSRRAWREVTQFRGWDKLVVRATDLCDRKEGGNQN